MEYILANNVEKLERLLIDKYEETDPAKIECEQYTEDFSRGWEVLDEDMLLAVEDIENMCLYAVDMQKKDCLSTIIGRFDWVNINAIICRIFQKDYQEHFSRFLHNRLSSRFHFQSLILHACSYKESAEKIIGKILHYVPKKQRKACFGIIFSHLNVFSGLKQLDDMMRKFIPNHSVFETYLLKSVGDGINSDKILEFIEQTPQYQWVGSDGNRFFHYASLHWRNAKLFKF